MITLDSDYDGPQAVPVPHWRPAWPAELSHHHDLNVEMGRDGDLWVVVYWCGRCNQGLQGTSRTEPEQAAARSAQATAQLPCM